MTITPLQEASYSVDVLTLEIRRLKALLYRAELQMIEAEILLGQERTKFNRIAHLKAGLCAWCLDEGEFSWCPKKAGLYHLCTTHTTKEWRVLNAAAEWKKLGLGP